MVLDGQGRPPIVTALLCLFIVLSGCLAGLGATSEPTKTQTTTPTSTPVPIPERPATLTNTSVLNYTIQYEIVATRSNGCGGAVDLRTSDGYYVVLECSLDVSSGKGSGSGGARAVVYFVNESVTTRLNIDSLDLPEHLPYKSPDSTENINRPYSIGVMNFDSQSHTLSLNVTYLNTSRTSSVYSEQHQLNSGKGLILPEITARQGYYRVKVAVDDKTSRTYVWKVPPRPEHSVYELSVYIAIDGSVSIHSTIRDLKWK